MAGRSSYKSAKKPAKKDMKAIRTVVKRAIRAQSELKRVAWGVKTTQRITEDGAYILPNVVGLTPTSFVLNGTQQGTDSSTRVGNQIRESGLRIRGMIMQSSTTPSDVCGCVRVFVVRDHDNKGTTPTLAEILDVSTTPYNIGSLVLWPNRKRFSFLFDQVFPLQAQASLAAAATACAAIDIDLPLSNVLTMSLNTRDAGSIQNGGLYCYMQYCNMELDPAASACPAFNGAVSFFFHDM